MIDEPRNVLLVEDNPDDEELTVRELERSQLKNRVAAELDLEAALELLGHLRRVLLETVRVDFSQDVYGVARKNPVPTARVEPEHRRALAEFPDQSRAEPVLSFDAG